MADFVLRISPNIIVGSHCVTRLGQMIKPYGKRFLLIIDPILRDYGTTDKIRQILSDSNIDYIIFEDIPSAPDTSILQQIVKLAKSAHIQTIIAVGGAKAITMGRATAALINEKKPLTDILTGDVPESMPIPCVCVPTTIRDPLIFSERVPLINERTRQVFLMKVPGDLCKLVMFDPNIINSLTKNQLSTMSLQSLCVALESYISTRASFFSDALAEKTFELLAGVLTGTNDSLANDLLVIQGGCMASLASASSSAGAASAIALAIHARYKISQSLVTSILFPYLVEDMVNVSEKMGVAAKKMGAAPETVLNHDASLILSENIRGRLARAGVPTRLKELSLSIEQLAPAVEDAARLEFVNFSPKSMSTENLFNLVKKAY